MEDEVVISGIAGRFPGCENVESLKQMLFNKISGVTSDDRRWKKGELDVPHHLGKINSPYHLDLTFFSINSKLGESMEPQTKMVMEMGFSAICDAGINPSDLAGTNTATLVGSQLAETEYECLITKKRLDQTILSHALCMQANRIAYYLDLKGPSYICDASWNGGFYALRYAKDMISRGNASAALVSCTNLIFMPQVSYHYQRLGRLNEDGKTKCFSDDADGYSRSEGCVAFFLQRKQDAFRNYGTIIGVDSTCYGSKDGPLSDITNVPFAHHLRNVYTKSKIDPSSINYLEASGCASKVVDASELNAAAEIFLPSRKDPLLIGSIKSNVGHTEAASALMGTIKAIIAAESDMIPPNIYYSSPNSLVPSLVAGKFQVVTEATPLNGDYLAVNNIAAAGDFGHLIMKRNSKIKKRVTEKGVLPPDGIPRLVLLSGREEDGLAEIIKLVEEMPIDEEFIALTLNVFGKGIKNHIYRGYTILDEDSTSKYHLIKPYPGGERKPVWFVFTGMGSQWAGMGAKLMKLPTFSKSIQFCHDELKTFGIDLIKIVTNNDESAFNSSILNAFVGITAMQIALIEILNQIGLVPDGIVGHSFGELACAYCDGSMTAKQAMLAAYNRGSISAQAKVEPGLMAAVGLGYDKVKKFGLPESIDIACHNSSESCTISGPVEDVKNYIEELQRKGIFARKITSGGIAYHSRYIKSLGQKFKEELKRIIPDPKERSPKWISSSVPKEKWNTEEAKFSSPEYHSNNLINSVLFEEACQYIPKDAVVIEIAPHGLLQAILRRTLPDAVHIPLTKKTDPDSLKFLLAAFGKMYTEGVDVDIGKLYPPVEFPVSRGTPSLATLLTWNTAGSYKPWTFLQKNNNVKISKEIIFNSNNEKQCINCTLNAVPFIPNAAYISKIMEEFLKNKNDEVTKIMFHKLKFKNLVKNTGDTTVHMTFQKGSGEWEITYSKEHKLVATGKIDTYIHAFKTQPIRNKTKSRNNLVTKQKVYSQLGEYGYTVESDLQLIKKLSVEDKEINAEIIWTGDWLAFLDAIFKIVELIDTKEHDELKLISSIERITIDLSEFDPSNRRVCTLNYNKEMGLIWGRGIEILYPSTAHPNTPLQTSPVNKRKYEFLLPKLVPFKEINNCTEENFFRTCLMIVLNNLYKKPNQNQPKLLVIEILENMSTPEVVNEILRNQSDLQVKKMVVSSDAWITKNPEEHFDGCSLIISADSNFENTLNFLGQSEGGYLIYKSRTPPSGLVVVITQRIGNETFFFCKTVKKHDKGHSFVLFNSEWKTNLIESLNQEQNRLTYLVAQCTSLRVINSIIEQTVNLKNSHKLRFVFIDSNLPSFRADKYEEHLKKDLRINIFTNGVWGTSILCPVNSFLPTTIMTNDNNKIFEFSQIKCLDVELFSLGLNLTDTSPVQPMLYEYCGKKQEESICGLATLNEGNFLLKPDPDYLWVKPKTMMDEEISSVLLSYTMAYYILEVEGRRKNISSILVHDGLSYLSQAVINIALSRKLKVFTTYDGKPENKDYLKNKYPQIHGNIFSYNTTQLEIPILLATKGKGVDVVVNAITDPKIIISTLKCISNQQPSFFQINIPSLHPEFTIGLGSFLGSACFHCIYPEALLSLPLQVKQSLKNAVANGFKTGEIKPISFKNISSSTLNIDISEMMGNGVNKCVVSMKGSFLSQKRTTVQSCNPNKLYMIIGNTEVWWFTLIDWLIRRGARQIIIYLPAFSSLAAQRINAILTNHDYVRIIVRSIKRHNCIDITDHFSEIETAFLIGEDNHGKMCQLMKMLWKTRIIVINNGPGTIKENQNANSNLLLIRTPKSPSYDYLLNALDSLMVLNETVVYMKELGQNELDTESTNLDRQHIPSSLNEIISFHQCPQKLFWRELRTSSPLHENCTELPPVFILPTLRKGQMKQLIKSLFHPAFVAVLPVHFRDINHLATQLFNEMKRFSCSVFTIICSDWMWLLGLELAKLLENSGKTVSLLLLGISPEWATSERIKMAYAYAVKSISSSDLEAYNKYELEMGLEILQERVKKMIDYTVINNTQFKGFCHLITIKKPTDLSLYYLKQSCQRNINLHMINENDYLSMLNSPTTADFINSNILFDQKHSNGLLNRSYDNIINANLSYTE